MDEKFLDDIKQSKTRTKRASYSIDTKVLEDFGKISKVKKYNKSKIIENFLKKFIEAEISLV